MGSSRGDLCLAIKKRYESFVRKIVSFPGSSQKISKLSSLYTFLQQFLKNSKSYRFKETARFLPDEVYNGKASGKRKFSPSEIAEEDVTLVSSKKK